MYTNLMKQVFTNNSHPISLFLSVAKLLEDKYGSEDWKLWEADTIAKEVNDHIKPYKLNNSNFNKIMAIKTLYTSDTIWDHWDLFLAVVQSLNDLPLNREAIYITENPLPFIYNTIEIMNLIRKQDFSEEVKRFCAAIFLHENVQYCPEPLNFAQIFVSNPRYHCNNCGKQGSALPPFQFVCDDCGGAYNSEEKTKLFNFKPLDISPETTNIEINLEFPVTDIRKRFDELKTKLETTNEDISLEENEIDIQCGKLIYALEYCGNELKKLNDELSLYDIAL